jgi:hypothetical protein
MNMSIVWRGVTSDKRRATDAEIYEVELKSAAAWVRWPLAGRPSK